MVDDRMQHIECSMYLIHTPNNLPHRTNNLCLRDPSTYQSDTLQYTLNHSSHGLLHTTHISLMSPYIPHMNYHMLHMLPLTHMFLLGTLKHNHYYMFCILYYTQHKNSHPYTLHISQHRASIYPQQGTPLSGTMICMCC